jgi:hypothetical protein
MNTGKNRVKGLKTELFKKKYQTDPMVKNLTDELQMSGNRLVVNQQPEPDIKRPASVYDQDFYQIPDYNIPTEEQRFSKSDELTKGMVPLDMTPGTTPEKQKTDWRDYVRTGVGVTAAVKGIYDDVQGRQDINKRIQNLNDRPRYMPNEFEYMGRPGSQSVIYAKQGAEIRTGTSSGAEEAELERGEMFMLPNMDSYVVGGKRHSQGGEDFVLPEGTVVFSDHLKVPGLKNTFATEAKKFDITKYKTILENPHAKAVDRTTAEVMMDRNMKKLQQLFQIQQTMNGNSNGEMETEGIRKGQKGLVTVGPVVAANQPQTSGPNASVFLTAEQKKQFDRNQGIFTNPSYSYENRMAKDFPTLYSSWNEENLSTKVDKAEDLTKQIQETTAQAEKNLAASQTASPAAPQGIDGPGNLGATAQPELNTATNQNKQVLSDEIGNVSKTNATDPNSIYRKKLPNGRTIYVEGQGEYANKPLADQYGNDPTNLLVNRYNEHYEELNPLLIDSYNSEVNKPELRVSDGNEVISLLSNGNNELTALRSFYKSINREEELFDVQLDKGYDPNIQRQKAAEKYKTWIESTQFADDVAKGKINPNGIFFIKNKPVAYKDDQGKTRYKIDNPEVDLDAIEKYQSAYKGIASLKKAESKKGKDKDRLRGFRVAPEGLADQVFLGMPISDDDIRLGNTSLGQVLGFEDQPLPQRTKPGETPVKDKDKGKGYNTKLQGAGTGKFQAEPFDYPQLSPEIYGMASSQMFPYAVPDYNAPYLMPQTLNIQPQLQDIDNSYVAAMNAGADPNNAFIATLGAKQRIYAEKQNFDAQQRASADQVNNQNRFQEDIYDMQALDRVYNTLIANADDAVTAQRQALVASASQKRAVWKQEEARKQFWYNSFVRNFDYDPKTRSFKVSDNASKEFADQLAQYGYKGLPEVDQATKTTSNTSSTKTTTKNEQTGTKTTTTEKTTPAATTTTTSTTSSPAPGSTTSVTKTNSTTTKAATTKKPATTTSKKRTK